MGFSKSGGKKYTPNNQSWIATEGQTVFTINNGSYTPGTKTIEVYVGGVKQIAVTNFTETSSTSFTLSEGVPAGTLVEAEWTQGAIPVYMAHNSTHKKGGADEINIIDIAGYKENVEDKMGLLSELKTTAKSNLKDAINEHDDRLGILSKSNTEWINVKDKAFGAKGDGVTDDAAAIQAAVNYAYTNNYKVVYFPYTPLGYFIKTRVLLEGDMELVGNNSKIVSIANATQTDVFFLNNKSGKVKISGFNAVSPNSNNVFLHIGGFTGDITIKECKTDGYLYTFKADNNNNINTFTVDDIVVNNGAMGFLMNDVKKFIGNNITTNLRDTSSYDHHYYFGEEVWDVSLTKIRANGGLGTVFQYNANDIVQSVNPKFIANDVVCHDISRFIATTVDMDRMYVSSVRIDNFRTISDKPDFIYLSVKTIDLLLENFNIENPYSLVSANGNTGHINVKLTFQNGSFGRMRSATSFQYIDEVNLINVKYRNILTGADQNAPGASSVLFFTTSSNNNSLVKVNVRDVELNVVTNGLTIPSSSNYRVIQMSHDAEYTFNNIRVFSDNATITDAAAFANFFFVFNVTLTNATVKFLNCDVRTLSAFELISTATIPYYYKTNTYFKRALVS